MPYKEYPILDYVDYLDYADYAWLESLSRDGKEADSDELYWYYYFK